MYYFGILRLTYPCDVIGLYNLLWIVFFLNQTTNSLLITKDALGPIIPFFGKRTEISVHMLTLMCRMMHKCNCNKHGFFVLFFFLVQSMGSGYSKYSW